MRLPRQLFVITGAAAVLAAIAVGGMSFAAPGIVAGGNGCPTVPVPTGTIIQAGIIQAFGETACPSPTEDDPPFTHTPTTGATEAPEPTEPVATTAPSTPVPSAPAATSTPSGGAGAGGVQPPSTGTGGADGATGATGMWVLAAFGLLAGGLGSLAYGMRRS